MVHKVIIDTDPGIDDTMALFFAFLAKEVDVIGITTVFGNVPVEIATRNAMFLCERAKAKVPVARGAEFPLVGPESSYAYFAHGEDGLGNTNPNCLNRNVDPRNAAQFIIEMAKRYPNEITLIAIGPLTNIALALKLEPNLPNLVKGLNIMGGAAFVPGNVSPYAEANFKSDPYAANIVLSENWPLTMFGLDVTEKVSYSGEWLSKLKKVNPKLGGLLNDIAQFYINFYSQNEPTNYCLFHDVMPLAYLVTPTLFSTKKCHCRVSIEPKTVGATIVSPNQASNNQFWLDAALAEVAIDVDGKSLKQLIEKTYACIE